MNSNEIQKTIPVPPTDHVNDAQNDETKFFYTTGIPTLRSSAHRVRNKPSKGIKIPQPQATSNCSGTLLPLSIRTRQKIRYDAQEYNLASEIISLFLTLDPDIVGSFPNTQNISSSSTIRLEDFRIPQKSVTRRANKGQCETAQHYLSNAIASSQTFLKSFDRLVREIVLPHLKSRLVNETIVKNDTQITFYYQRPPTLRLQPGPARAFVKTHRDSDYGHQPGELNYWIPLTDVKLTGVDLWCESDADVGDYSPLGTRLGEISSFHGSACRHYVNRNETGNTRVSLDFRVGIEPFYDPEWEMLGTRADHLRERVDL